MGTFSRRQGVLVVISVLLGCGGPPPEPPPSVAITSPGSFQTLPAGQPIEVRFTVSGVDSSGAMPTPFRLETGAARVAGVGKVVAFIDASSAVAATTALPSDAQPFRVPDGAMGDPATLLTPGRHTIFLRLYYNDGTLVSPQREGSVGINAQ